MAETQAKKEMRILKNEVHALNNTVEWILKAVNSKEDVGSLIEKQITTLTVTQSHQGKMIYIILAAIIGSFIAFILKLVS